MQVLVLTDRWKRTSKAGLEQSLSELPPEDRKRCRLAVGYYVAAKAIENRTKWNVEDPQAWGAAIFFNTAEIYKIGGMDAADALRKVAADTIENFCRHPSANQLPRIVLELPDVLIR